MFVVGKYLEDDFGALKSDQLLKKNKKCTVQNSLFMETDLSNKKVQELVI